MHYEAPNESTTSCGVSLWEFHCGMAATRNGVPVAYDLPDVDCEECLTAIREIKYPLSREQVENLSTILSDAQHIALQALGMDDPTAVAVVEKLSEAFRLLDDVRGIIR